MTTKQATEDSKSVANARLAEIGDRLPHLLHIAILQCTRLYVAYKYCQPCKCFLGWTIGTWWTIVWSKIGDRLPHLFHKDLKNSLQMFADTNIAIFRMSLQESVLNLLWQICSPCCCYEVRSGRTLMKRKNDDREGFRHRWLQSYEQRVQSACPMVDWRRQTRGALMPLGLFLSQLFGKKEDSPELTESPDSPYSKESPDRFRYV